MKGYKTVIFGLFLAIAPAAVTYLGGVNWESYGISPQAAAILGMIVVGLRAITTTPLGMK